MKKNLAILCFFAQVLLSQSARSDVDQTYLVQPKFEISVLNKTNQDVTISYGLHRAYHSGGVLEGPDVVIRPGEFKTATYSLPAKREYLYRESLRGYIQCSPFGKLTDLVFSAGSSPELQQMGFVLEQDSSGKFVYQQVDPSLLLGDRTEL